MKNIIRILITAVLLLAPYSVEGIKTVEAASLMSPSFSSGAFSFNWFPRWRRFFPGKRRKIFPRTPPRRVTKDVPELDPNAAGQVAALLLGCGALLIARRRQNEFL